MSSTTMTMRGLASVILLTAVAACSGGGFVFENDDSAVPPDETDAFDPGRSDDCVDGGAVLYSHERRTVCPDQEGGGGQAGQGAGGANPGGNGQGGLPDDEPGGGGQGGLPDDEPGGGQGGLPDDRSPRKKVVICHYPPGNPDNAHTISIGAPAVAAHLAHGDSLGPCPES